MVLAAADTKERQRERPQRRRAPDRVSCTVVCQDEAGQIAGCLESVSWCDEIVVVDGGSRDGTVEIARRFTPRVIHNPWPGYRAQKQFALEHATGEWVLNLDADERVTPELATEIQAALREVPDTVDGFRIPRLVSYLGRWWYRGGWYPRPVTRLVRRAQTVWGGTDPHDRAVIPGRVIGLTQPILHYTYDDIADHLHSVDKLTAVAARQVPSGRRIGLGRLAGEPAWRFLRAYFIKRGAQEGLPGFFVAATDAFYTFLRWARVWERERGS
jgi:glycosyltransferase involved in cell wall biosynthesis